MSYDIYDKIEMMSQLQLQREYLEALNEIERLNKQITVSKENIIKDTARVFGDYYDNLRLENEQLRGALKKCKPNWSGYCDFCGNRDNSEKPHADDCEYIKLIGNGEIE